MKNLFYFTICIALLIPGLQAKSQNLARHVGCSDPFVLHQVDSIKSEFSRLGFIVLKEASLAMESNYEIPVIVPLTEGTRYQVVFIGDAGSSLSELRLFDWDEKQVAYQTKRSGESDGNVISYAYTPAFSQYHMMKPLQVNTRMKDMSGYVMLLKKVHQ